MLTKQEIDNFYLDLGKLDLRFPVAAISKATGFGKSQVSDYINKVKSPSENFLKSFYKSFKQSITNVPQETVVEEPKGSYLKTRREIKNTIGKKAIPFYDAPAVAGLIETDMTPIHAPAGTIDIGDLLHDSKAAIRIYGNSMNPNYPPGCVLGLAPAEDSFIEPGEVYVIETKYRRIFKRLFYKEDDTNSEYISCYSDNIMKFEGGSRHGKLAYPPFDLPKKEIIRLFVVTGVIKRNANSIIINH